MSMLQGQCEDMRAEKELLNDKIKDMERQFDITLNEKKYEKIGLEGLN